MGGGGSKEIGGEGSLSVKDNEEDGRISKLQEQLSFVMPAKCIYVGGVQRYREGIQRRRNKRQAGIFHPPVGERPRHAQDIVAPPFVGPRILERVPIVAIKRKLEVRGGWTRRFAVSQCRHDRSERVWCRYRRRVRCLHAPGVSWQRRKDRALIAWYCVKRKGCFFPSVWAGGSHWIAPPALAVSYSMATVTSDPFP